MADNESMSDIEKVIDKIKECLKSKKMIVLAHREVNKKTAEEFGILSTNLSKLIIDKLKASDHIEGPVPDDNEERNKKYPGDVYKFDVDMSHLNYGRIYFKIKFQKQPDELNVMYLIVISVHKKNMTSQRSG